uniref:mRNA-capping enzyme n=1 Tax=Timema tahoe TaxID=61484 RepID=A0A7R9FLJ1_9NEOP|nr:unnamed protein product [Timema tahoe]
MSGHHEGRNPGSIPNRWLHCPRKSSGLIANKFLAFKTPLSEKFNDQVPSECRFGPKMIFNSMKSYKVSIGLWIDLTNTSRFYDKAEVESENCRYLKLQCRGHGETPSEEQTRTFIHICQKFIAQHPSDIIGVHCTHGFNRTGFLIVSYLVEQINSSVGGAIKQFAEARPPGIYKADYLQELFRKYDDVEDTPSPPELPDWCREYDDSNVSLVDDDTSHDKNGATSLSKGGKKRKREFQNKNPTFVEGVSGISAITFQPKLGEIQRKVQEFCGWESTGFPGCQPVSMDNSNIRLLHDKPYRVSWKADGTRYMMLILKANEVYCVDRDNSVFQVTGLKFPHRKNLDKHLTNTLLDGEMVIDKFNGKDIPRYLAYDIIKFEGQDVGKSSFSPIRLSCIDNEIVQPRHKAMKEGRIDKESEPFSIRLKQFWNITQAGNLLGDKFSKMLSHEPDGLIFQPSIDPYVAGRCMEVLKWKPPSHNSVDFKLKIVMEGGEGILPRKIGQLFVGGLETPFASMKITKATRELNNKIIECKIQDNQWTFMRERTDKSFPNSYNTAQAVCNSIRDPVTTHKLLDFIEQHRWLPDHDLMPPPNKISRR